MEDGTLLGARLGIEKMGNDFKTGEMRAPRKLCLLSKIAFNNKFQIQNSSFFGAINTSQ